MQWVLQDIDKSKRRMQELQKYVTEFNRENSNITIKEEQRKGCEKEIKRITEELADQDRMKEHSIWPYGPHTDEGQGLPVYHFYTPTMFRM